MQRHITHTNTIHKQPTILFQHTPSAHLLVATILAAPHCHNRLPSLPKSLNFHAKYQLLLPHVEAIVQMAEKTTRIRTHTHTFTLNKHLQLHTHTHTYIYK